MFNEDYYGYEKIDEKKYNELMDLYEDEQEVKGTIYSFYEDEHKNIHKLINLEKPCDSWILLSKYYVVSMNLDEEVYDIERKLIHIINLGYFIVSGPLYKKNNNKTIFDIYDKNYKNLKFEFTDDEFLEKHNYFNAIKIYKNGEKLNYSDKLFTDFLKQEKDKDYFKKFRNILLYAYKGKEIRFISSIDIDKAIDDLIELEQIVKRILKVNYSDVGIVFKKDKNDYKIVMRIGYSNI